MSSLYTEAKEAPLEERRLKLSMHYYVKTRACIDNPANHALHEFDQTTRDLYAPRPNGRGGMTQPPAAPIGLKVEEAMTSAEINAELVCPLTTPNFPPGTHDYDPKRHYLIEGVSKCMISGQEAQAKFNEFREAQRSPDEVYNDGSKMNERVGAAAVINRHFQNGETTCRQLSKRLPDNSTIFAAEATAISLALNYYRAIVLSKFDYGCIVYGTASNTNLRQLDSIHNSGLRLALGAFCTSPVSSLYTEANEAPFEERRLKLSMHYYVKTRACIDNPAHHALHEFDRTTRDLYATRPNGRGGMTRPPAPPIGLKVEEAMTSAEINAELVCPLPTPNFPPGTHDYDPKRHDLIEGVSKCMISGQEAQAKFNEFREA